MIEKTRANHSQLFLCYVDLKKAFDSIQHSLLWKKLHALGVSGQIIRVLQSMYAKATARVKLTTSEATKSFSCQKGVRQGCNLSPLLFSHFLSGLEMDMAEHEAGVPLMDATLNMMMFVDDIVLLSTSAQGLRKRLETLVDYYSNWNLQINEAKTKVSVFGTNYTHQFHCNSLPLEVVEDYKYLELWISKKTKKKKPYFILAVNLRK